MNTTIDGIKKNVEKLEFALIDDWLPYEDEEGDSLLEDYTRKFNGYIQQELDFYYRLL